MIIDAILDRKDGIAYNPADFYRYIFGFVGHSADEAAREITHAMDCGDESDVKKALCNYVIDYEYNPTICAYINSVDWLVDDVTALKAKLDSVIALDAIVIAAKDNRIAELEARIAELEAAAIEPETAAIEPETISDPIPVLTPIDRIAQRFQLDGVTVTVKGAATDSPVIWISGDTKPHKDELKSMGAKWAPKKGAWYYKPAAELAAIEAA